MNYLNHSKKKYLILLPVFFLVANAFYFSYASKKIQETILEEKFVETINHVDMLAAGVGANSSRYWEAHEKNILDSVRFIDNLHLTYASAYKPVDGKWALISERDYASTFDPFAYEAFSDAIAENVMGTVDVGYTPEGGLFRVMHVYFRHMPLYSPPEERYLLVAAVSQYSVVTSIPAWVSIGQWFSTIVTFGLNVWMIIMIARLGVIYDEREGEKWRDRRG